MRLDRISHQRCGTNKVFIPKRGTSLVRGVRGTDRATTAIITVFTTIPTQVLL